MAGPDMKVVLCGWKLDLKSLFMLLYKKKISLFLILMCSECTALIIFSNYYLLFVYRNISERLPGRQTNQRAYGAVREVHKIPGVVTSDKLFALGFIVLCCFRISNNSILRIPRCHQAKHRYWKLPCVRKALFSNLCIFNVCVSDFRERATFIVVKRTIAFLLW